MPNVLKLEDLAVFLFRKKSDCKLLYYSILGRVTYGRLRMCPPSRGVSVWGGGGGGKGLLYF